MDPHQIDVEMRRAQAAFHQLITGASPDDLQHSTDGTRWTNRQLLFHMVLGYGVVRTLLPLVRARGASVTAAGLPPPSTPVAARSTGSTTSARVSLRDCSPRARSPRCSTAPSAPSGIAWPSRRSAAWR